MIICVLDTETTGLKPEYHEVIQTAAILCDSDLNEISRFSFKVKPERIERASKKALEVNGYHPRTWKPTYSSTKEALKALNGFIKRHSGYNEDVVLAGQNIKFDYDFLYNAYMDQGVLFPFSSVMLDLIYVAKFWSKINKNPLRRYNLKTLAEFTGQTNTNPHDAEADTEVTLDILRWFIIDLRKAGQNDRKCFNKKSSIKV